MPTKERQESNRGDSSPPDETPDYGDDFYQFVTAVTAGRLGISDAQVAQVVLVYGQVMDEEIGRREGSSRTTG